MCRRNASSDSAPIVANERMRGLDTGFCLLVPEHLTVAVVPGAQGGAEQVLLAELARLDDLGAMRK
jgi:hypothetical protein